MSGKIYQGSHLVAQTNDAPLGFEDKGIVLESLAQYEQLEKDGNLQEDVNYYIKDIKLVIRNNQKYGTSINDSANSVSTTYSSSKIEEINTPVWSGTQSEFEALDKTTLKDGQVINITDDYDGPDSYPVITVYDNGFVFKYKNGVMQQYGKGTISEGYVAFFENFIDTGYIIVYSSSNASAYSMGNRFVAGFGVAGSVDGDIIDYVATGKWK